jgi:peptidoglycan/LPS O-acetylase OafA/YrhL
MHERLSGLDALRGLAALSVVLYHFTWFYGYKIDTSFAPSISFPFGSYGVDLFFVISGFVIFMTLERATTLRSFAVTRFARLYPAFWAAVGITIIARALDGRLAMSLGAVLANLTMVPTLFGTPFVDGVYWTLFYELGFYVLAGGFFATGCRQPEFACLGWLLASILFLNYAPVLPHGSFLLATSITSFSPLLVTGIMIYRIRQNRRNLASYAVLLTAIFCSSSMPAVGVNHINGITNGAVTAILAVVVWGGARVRRTGSLGFVFFGEISYSLYLVHSEVGYSLLHLGTIIGLSNDFSVVLALMTVVAISTVINKCIERPAQRWIKNMYTRQGTLLQLARVN